MHFETMAQNELFAENLTSDVNVLMASRVVVETIIRGATVSKKNPGCRGKVVNNIRQTIVYKINITYVTISCLLQNNDVASCALYNKL